MLACKEARSTRLRNGQAPASALAEPPRPCGRSRCGAPLLPRRTARDAAHRATAVAASAAAASLAATGPPTSSLSASSTPSAVWTRTWTPITPVSYLDRNRPNASTVLGRPLVLWLRAEDGVEEWVVMDDVCPHRLAPLSEGRLEGGGTRLACAYHGWEFASTGACTRVPQLAADNKAAAAATASRRSCVTAYPARVVDGVLYAWLDASAEGRAAAATAAPPKTMDDDVVAFGDWYMNELPNDYRFWVEQGMDPAHASFLHHGIGAFRKENAVAMEGERVRDVDLTGGWQWRHRGYETKNQSMHALREFLPPYTIRATYEQKGSATQIVTLTTPVRPGVSRVFFRIGARTGTPPAAAEGAAAGQAAAAAAAAASSKAGTAAPAARAAPRSPLLRMLTSLLGRVPHWLTGGQSMIADQDTVMMARQERLMRDRGLEWRDYNLNSRSDEGVAAINRWLDLANYPSSVWGQQAPDSVPRARSAAAASQTYGGWPQSDLSIEQLLSRQERHVRHCAVCRRGLRQVTAVCWALSLAAAAAACAAIAVAVVAVVAVVQQQTAGGVPAPAADVLAATLLGVACPAVAALALGALAVRAWSLRTQVFISGLPQWQRVGGYAGMARSK